MKQLSDYIFHFEDVLDKEEHARLLHLAKTHNHDPLTCPERQEDLEDEYAYYDLQGTRSHTPLEREDGEIYDLTHKAMMRTLPKIYQKYKDLLPYSAPPGDIDYDKYSGYWLCKYPTGGFLSFHADVDADAASVTCIFLLNDDFEGGQVYFWGEHEVNPPANSIHVYPSNHLFPHEVKPITKGERYSIVVWFGYHKGYDWS